MKKTAVLCLIFTSLMSYFAVGQVFLYHHQRTIDLAKDVVNYTLEATSDGGYAIALSYYEPQTSTPYWGIILLKLDPNLDLEWSKEFAEYDTSLTSIIPEDIIETSNGDFGVCGYYTNSGAASKTAFILTANVNGDIQWVFTYAPNSEFNAIVERPDQDGYIVCGYMPQADSVTMATVIKVDASGAVVWTKGVKGLEFDQGSSVFEDIILTLDDTLVVVGHANEFKNGIQTDDADVLITKLDLDGNVTGNWIYNDAQDLGGEWREYAYSVLHDGDYLYLTGKTMGDSIITDSLNTDSVISRYSLYEDVLAMQINYSDGSVNWHQRYNLGESGVIDYNNNSECGEKIDIYGDSLAISGYVRDYRRGTGSMDGFLLCTSPGGNALWHTQFGDDSDDYFYDMEVLNGFAVMAGYTNSFNLNNGEVYVVECFQYITDTCYSWTFLPYQDTIPDDLDSASSEQPDVAASNIELNEQELDPVVNIVCDKKLSNSPRLSLVSQNGDESIRIYPNPFTDNLTIDLPCQAATVTLRTLDGRVVLHQQINHSSILALGSLAPGVYYLEIDSKNLTRTSRLVIKQ